jgi:hypothetical protein
MAESNKVEIITALPEAPQGSLLESAIRAAHAGTLSSAEVVRTLATGKIAVPSKAEVRDSLSDLRAVVLDKEGKSFLAVFSTVERAEALRNMAAYCVLVDALTVLQSLDADLGVVINPGTDVVMEISAEGVRRIVQQFGTAVETHETAPN